MIKFRVQGPDSVNHEYIYVSTRQDESDDVWWHLDIAVWPMDPGHLLGEIICYDNGNEWTPTNWVCA